MLTTTEGIAILERAEQLAGFILQSEVVENYRLCLAKLQNKDTQGKIAEFSKAKELYEEVQRFGKYHPDYKKVMMDIRVLKREVDLDENVANFKVAENELQAMLDEVSMIIGHSVSKNVKVPTGNPFFDSSCSGGCGSGGSCGCSA
ncbi:YlbF family regulator [Cytobacillus spongiae]|uniref:YlbF family regulator n=1 Tax=Cytobacillus spongiae TaxID=2901381 RepID=UPI001F350105|nr:YlbF family regulator [Cytobacillus spongiae]UII57291.1 YlbF family regulator [Cytobacillus spongiae]